MSVVRHRPLASLAAVSLPLASALFLVFAGKWWPRPYSSYSYSRIDKNSDANPDATTLIGTLVVVYTFFIAAYGALTPPLISKKGSNWWKVTALGYILLAVALDLFRVWNSTGDLYATTLRALPASKVYDAAAEFTRYLLVNVAVLIIVFVVVCLPDRHQTLPGAQPESHPGSGDADPK